MIGRCLCSCRQLGRRTACECADRPPDRPKEVPMRRRIKALLLGLVLGGSALALRDCAFFIPFPDGIYIPDYTVDVFVDEWYVEPWPVVEVWDSWWWW